MEFYLRPLLFHQKELKIITSGNATITADRILLQRAIGNLIANAVHHSPPKNEIQTAEDLMQTYFEEKI